MSILNPKAIIVHCSASVWGDAAAITEWHRQRGFDTCGYHKVILNGVRQAKLRYIEKLDGKIEPGRDEHTQGAHCKAQGMNSAALGVCLIGNPGWPPAGPAADSKHWVRPYVTERQVSALIHVLTVWCREHGLNPKGEVRVQGRLVRVISQHSDHDPGKPFCASMRLDWICEAVAEALKAEGS